MARRTIADIEKIWSNVEGIKKLSDRTIGVGPFGIGLDGLLTWIPVVGTTYSVGAAGWLLLQAVRAKAPPGTLVQMAGYLGLDSMLTSAGEFVPFGPDLIDLLFTGHLFAANALQKHIETTHWIEDSEAAARASGAHDRHMEFIRTNPDKKRVVYLHD